MYREGLKYKLPYLNHLSRCFNWYINLDIINLCKNVSLQVSVYCQMYYSKQVAVFCTVGFGNNGALVGAMGVCVCQSGSELYHAYCNSYSQVFTHESGSLQRLLHTS